MPITSSTLHGCSRGRKCRKFGSRCCFRPAEVAEPVAAAAQDRRHHGDGLDVVDRRRTAVEANAAGNGGFSRGCPLLALEALEQRRLLAADIGARAKVDVTSKSQPEPQAFGPIRPAS
jgi:hypothetical protein